MIDKKIILVEFDSGPRQEAVRLALIAHNIHFHVVSGAQWVSQPWADDLVSPEPTVVVFEAGAPVPEFLTASLQLHKSSALVVADARSGAVRVAESLQIQVFSESLQAPDFIASVVEMIGRWHQVHKRDWGTDVLHAVAGANVVASSPAMNETLQLVEKVSQVDAGVFINGETGTGKELIARAIHYMSERCDDPFIPVNCGAFTDDLLLSELFGHEKGAFTGAEKSHTGLIERANGGTLFLDEIDTLSAKAQVVLLRYLQEQEYRPVGGDDLRSTDVRVIAASNADIDALVARNEFRQDLWFRIEILRVDLPPLRDRHCDIFLLSQFFLRQIADKYRREIKVLHADTVDWMERYAWPGNVRELENFLHRVFLMTDEDVLKVPAKGALTETPQPPVRSFQDAKNQCIRDFERDYLERVLRETGGNITLAARRAEKERRAFTRLMEKYDIRREQFLSKDSNTH